MERKELNDTITLDRLPIGSSGMIRAVGGEGPLRLRLLDMGLIPRTRVTMRKVAPMGRRLEPAGFSRHDDVSDHRRLHSRRTA